MDNKKIHCIHCNTLYEGKIKRSLLTGIKRFTCSECKNINYIALNTLDRRTNIGLMLFFLGLFLYYLVFEGEVVLPGIIFVWPLISFIANKRVESGNFNIQSKEKDSQ